MKHYLLLCSMVAACMLDGHLSYAGSYPIGTIDPKVLATQKGAEELVYKVSWTGGLPIGNVWIEVKGIGKERDDHFEIVAKVKSSGLLNLVYPVNDSFSTIVDGTTWLPISYRVTQKEGRSYEAHRFTEYDQKRGEIRYQKNEQEPEYYKVAGEVHNEFTLFFMTRLLRLSPNQPVIVPTFADKDRHEVVVRTGKSVRIGGSVRGDVNVLPVRPRMNFKGLYEKDGDTEIWLTDDECRIPVRIASKILVGSITAELVSYSNPFCADQSDYHISLSEENLQLSE